MDGPPEADRAGNAVRGTAALHACRPAPLRPLPPRLPPRPAPPLNPSPPSPRAARAVPCLSRASDLEAYDPSSEFALAGDEDGWTATHRDPAADGGGGDGGGGGEEAIPSIEEDEEEEAAAAAAGEASGGSGAGAARARARSRALHARLAPRCLLCCFAASMPVGPRFGWQHCGLQRRPRSPPPNAPGFRQAAPPPRQLRGTMTTSRT